ncbi:MAG: polysaccharide deacetylase family protein [Armatimonadetes bacterium]|nr:polysaccharide deacetylase family protein [Armatimonadota bacterium]
MAVRSSLCFLSLSLVLWACPARGASHYLADVAAGADLLARGERRAAIQAFERAGERDMNDPLAAAGLGHALECDGQPEAAAGPLSLALSLDGSNPAAQWAAALSALNGGSLEDAHRRLEALAGAEDPIPPSVRIALAYARCASGDGAGAAAALAPIGSREGLPSSQRSLAALVLGAVAYTAGESARAAELLREAANHLPPVAFTDLVPLHRAPLVPEARGARMACAPLGAASGAAAKARPVSGTVPLYLDPFRIPGTHYARFFVDGRCLQTTNATPYSFAWNTRKVRNGLHKVVIRGEDENGALQGETEEVVLVRNEGVSFPPLYAEAAYREASEALCRAMLLQPDPLATHYLLGRALRRLGEEEAAAASLETVMGFDPDFGRAREELTAIYKARNGHRIHGVSSVPTTERQIAVTFDDGPNAIYTPPLLDLLERFHARATMFLVGTQAEQHPDIAREIVARGHEVANHTYSHANLKTLDRPGIERELLRCRSVLRRLTGRAVTLFRPPGGNVDVRVAETCAEYGFTSVYWDQFDSWLQKHDEATVLTKLVAGVRPGSIILLHNGNNKTSRIVEPFLEEMSRQGYRMVTVSELLSHRAPGSTPPSDALEAPELADPAPGR